MNEQLGNTQTAHPAQKDSNIDFCFLTSKSGDGSEFYKLSCLRMITSLWGAGLASLD